MMTDNEIIKALECLAGTEIMCKDCSFSRFESRGFACKKNVSTAAIDLINRQKAEIERLTEAGKEAVSCFTRMESFYKIKCKEIEIARAEAIKEFAEGLKKHFETYTDDEESNAIYMRNLIDDLVEEMTEKGGVE